MKTRSVKEEGSGATEHAEAARAAQAAIENNPDSPENYAALAGALRLLAQSLRERNAENADHLLHLACAAAWEAKRMSGPGLTSGRTKQELKILIAWLRTKNHVAPEAAEKLIDQIHSEYLSRALEKTDLFQEARG